MYSILNLYANVRLIRMYTITTVRVYALMLSTFYSAKFKKKKKRNKKDTKIAAIPTKISGKVVLSIKIVILLVLRE